MGILSTTLLSVLSITDIEYFNEGSINDGEPFKACITLFDADSKNCADGLNHIDRQSESVLLKAPNVVKLLAMSLS